MSKKPYDLMADEQVIIKEDKITRSLLAPYNDELILTNQRIIWVNYGLFGKCKEVENYPLSQVKQAILGKAKNGDKQLEIHMTNGIEAFLFQAFGKKKIQKWIDAISNQLIANEIKNKVKEKQIQLVENGGIVKSVIQPLSENKQGAKIVGEFVGDVAKSVLKSGKISPAGITKGIVTASKKQIRKNGFNIINQTIENNLGDSGSQEEFIETGNEFHEDSGVVLQTTENQQSQQVDANNSVNTNVSNNPNGSVDKQIETIKKLKELLDIGVLSQEEFEIKKKEVLGL